MIKAAEKILGMVADKFAVLSILEDLEDRFIRDCTDKGKGYALINFISRYLLVLSSFIIESINWRIIMFRNYLKIAIRDIKNQKAFSAIKIFSLAIGLATSVLILIWVQYELSFDMFHENSDSIYRMASSYEFNGIERTAPWFPRPMGQALKESFPEVIDYARYDHRRNFDRIQYGDVVDYGSTLLMTDRSFFEVFDFTFLEGNPETALSDLNSVVITEKMAEKFFGDEDPVGKILLFLDKKIPTKITGVLKNIPENSHIQFDYLVPVGISDKWWGGGSERSEWDAAYTSVYLHIRDDFVKDDLERKIVEFYKQKSNTKGIENIEVWLEPLSDIHLRSDLFYDHANNSKGNIIHVYVFIFIAVSVLFIACVNFMNLSTARSAKRSLEVGIRKVNGAYKKDIIKQFLSESVFMSFVALMIAIVLVYTLIPVLRELSGRELDLSFLDNGKILLYVLLITLGTGLISGSYPAFFLSSVDLVNVLKSKYGSGKISVFNFRRFLVVFQFLCTTVLIVISLVIYFQLDFIKNKDLGFDKENILSFTYHREFWGKFDTLKEELLKNPDISYVTSGFSPSMNKRGHAFGGIDWEGKAVDQNVPMDLYFAYYDFPEALGIEMAEGRYFSKDHPGDGKQYVLNEAAIKAMGMKDPIGKTFTPDPGLDGKIIGVIKDFHTSTLKAKIVPTYFICKPNIRAIVRISPDNIDQTIEYVESIWNQFLPDREFEYYFLDDELNEFYRDDRKSAKIIQYFALLTLFVSCIGLLGLVSYYTEQKTKEIGIRKTLGASVAGIISLISREFIIMVAIGNFIALPLSYIIGREWLDTFAYRIGLDWWIFGLSTLVLLVITLLTIKYQTIKAAMMNPTDALRYE